MTKSGERVRKVRKNKEWGLCIKYYSWVFSGFRWAVASARSFPAANPTLWGVVNNGLRMDIIHFMGLCRITSFTVHPQHHTWVAFRESSSAGGPVQWDLAAQLPLAGEIHRQALLNLRNCRSIQKIPIYEVDIIIFCSYSVFYKAKALLWCWSSSESIKNRNRHAIKNKLHTATYVYIFIEVTWVYNII